MRASKFIFGWTVTLSVFMLCFTLSHSLSMSLSPSFFRLFTNTHSHPLISTESSASAQLSYSWNKSQCIRCGVKDWQSLTQTAAFLTEMHQLYWRCRQHRDDWRWQAKCEVRWGTKKEITHEYHNGNEQAKLLSLFARCRVAKRRRIL